MSTTAKIMSAEQWFRLRAMTWSLASSTWLAIYSPSCRVRRGFEDVRGLTELETQWESLQPLMLGVPAGCIRKPLCQRRCWLVA